VIASTFGGATQIRVARACAAQWRCTDGRSSRDSARSSVDLPQAFGPTITVNEPSGISTPRCSAITRCS